MFPTPSFPWLGQLGIKAFDSFLIDFALVFSSTFSYSFLFCVSMRPHPTLETWFAPFRPVPFFICHNKFPFPSPPFGQLCTTSRGGRWTICLPHRRDSETFFYLRPCTGRPRLISPPSSIGTFFLFWFLSIPP